MLRTELETCRSVLAGGDRAALQQLGPMEDEIDRFYLLMVRQLLLSSDDFQIARDIGVESHHYQIGYRLIAKVLEVTGDLVSGGRPGAGRQPSRAPAACRSRPSSDLVALIARVERLLERTMDAFTRLSVVDANANLNEIDRVATADYTFGDALARHVSDHRLAVSAQRVVSNLLMTLEMLVIINEVTINRGVEPETVAKTDRRVGMHSLEREKSTP